MSLRGDEIVLRSQRLGQRVMPRMTSAHNWAWGDYGDNTLPVDLDNILAVESLVHEIKGAERGVSCHRSSRPASEKSLSKKRPALVHHLL